MVSTRMPGRAPSSRSARDSRTPTSRYPMLPTYTNGSPGLASEYVLAVALMSWPRTRSRPTGLHDQAPARAPHPRIDHRKVHGAAAEVARAREKHERARRDIESRHLMRHVDQHRAGTAGENDAFHRRDEWRAGSEIGRESDDRRCG